MVQRVTAQSKSPIIGTIGEIILCAVPRPTSRPNSTSGKIRTMLASGREPGEIAKKLGCSASLVYNLKAGMAGGGNSRPSVGLRRAFQPHSALSQHLAEHRGSDLTHRTPT
jgi:hypothetical protein